MSAASDVAATAAARQAIRRKWRWIGLAGGLCLLSWLALAIGLLLQVGTGTRLALATAAALTTEGTCWLAALLLGVGVLQARRRLWRAATGRRAVDGGRSD